MNKINDISIEEYQEFFKEELDMINQEIQENRNLYTEIKTHLDKVKTSSTAGALTFISKQTPNLLTAKNNEISLLKDLVSVKKIILDVAMKNKKETDGSEDSELLKSLHNLLLTNKRDEYLVSLEKEEPAEDINYDDLFNERIKELEINNEKESDETKEKESDDYYKLPKGYKFVLDTEDNIYIVDKEYNIIEPEDINVSLPKDWIIEVIEKDDEMIGRNQYGEEYEIIEFDDED